MKTKLKLFFGIMIILALPLAMADSYEWFCLGEGETFDFGETCNPNMPSYDGPDIFCLNYLDSGAICSADFSKCEDAPSCEDGDNGPTDVTPPEITVNSPVEGEIYSSKSVLFDIGLSEEAEIEYNINGGSWKSVCSSCDSYDNKKSLEEGLNDLVIKAEDDAGNVEYYDLSITIDSKDPKLNDLQPDDGFASGDFFVEFEEANPSALRLIYGTSDDVREYTFDIENECNEDDDVYECNSFVDLSDFDGKEITVYAEIEDIAGSVDDSKDEELLVDFSAPIIESLDYSISGKYVTFTLEIDESNFDEAEYYDNSASKPSWKSLCTKLTNGVCSKKVSFTKDGAHEVDIQVIDDAGNTIGGSASFFTDSDDPKIKDITPDGKFAGEEFYIKFEEANPESLFLNYGTSNDMREREVDIGSECEFDGEETYECWFEVDVVDFEGEEIDYDYVLTDIVGNTDEDDEKNLEVDTSIPVIESLSYETDDDEVIVVFAVDDENFDKIQYRNLAKSSSWKTFCSSLKNGECDKDLDLEDGENNFEFKVWDDADNFAEANLDVFL